MPIKLSGLSFIKSHSISRMTEVCALDKSKPDSNPDAVAFWLFSGCVTLDNLLNLTELLFPYP